MSRARVLRPAWTAVTIAHKLRWTWDRRSHVWRCEGRPELRVSPAYAKNCHSRFPIRGLKRGDLVFDGWTLTPGGDAFDDYHGAMLAAESIEVRGWKSTARALARAEKKAQQTRRAS